MMNGSGEEGGEVVQSNGRLRLVHLDSLPPGYRFCPTDEEVLGYLRMKVHHQQLPPNKIVELNLYAHHPEQLAVSCKPQGDNEWYYFTPRERKYTNGQRPKRSIADGHGYWKATGAEKDVIDSENTKIGYKRALVFYQGNHPYGVKTNWLMHEFRVAIDPPPTTDSNLGNTKPFDDYVLCKVYKKKGGDTGPKRSPDELKRNGGASASSPRIPKLHLTPTPASDQFMANGELESPDYAFVSIPQGLQNQQQPVRIQMPQVSSACAVFPPPPPAADVSLYRGSGRPWDESLMAAAAAAMTTVNERENGVTVGGNGMGYVEEYRAGYHDQCMPVDNFPYGFQYQQEQHQQLQQPVVPQNNLQVLPSAAQAGGEFSWHDLNGDHYPMQNVPSTQRDNPNDPGGDNQMFFPWSNMIVHSSYPPSSAPATDTSQQQPCSPKQPSGFRHRRRK